MKTKTLSPQTLRKRKFLIVLPVLILPFVTLLFWALGGGNTNDLQAQQTSAKPGFNMELPNANLKDEQPLDKLSYYEKAALDSAKLEELIKNDPNYLKKLSLEGTDIFINDSIPISTKHMSSSSYTNLNTSPFNKYYQDPNEAKVYSKLEQLDKAMNQASIKSADKLSTNSNRRTAPTSISSSDINRLEQMMEMNKQGGGEEDPEMQQLNGIMERILDIQHPERVKERIRETSGAHKGQVFAVNANSDRTSTSLLLNNKSSQSKFSTNRFHSLNESIDTIAALENAIKAVIHQSQVLIDGSVVKLRLLQDIYINGNLIPKNNFVFGTASLNGERLSIEINSIRYNNSLYPVSLSVYDMDGMDGIYIPGAITRDVAKQSADRAVQGINLTSVDPSLKVQAATAGIEAAKTLLSRKAKLIKVMVKAGYQVLIKDEKQTSAF